MKPEEKTIRRARRRRRVRAKVFGTASRPRLSVFRSNTRIVAQVINDEIGNTVVAVSTSDIEGTTLKDRAVAAGAALAEKAKKAGVETVVFDRGGYAYTGNIKAFAEAVREAGLVF